MSTATSVKKSEPQKVDLNLFESPASGPGAQHLLAGGKGGGASPGGTPQATRYEPRRRKSSVWLGPARDPPYARFVVTDVPETEAAEPKTPTSPSRKKSVGFRVSRPAKVAPR